MQLTLGQARYEINNILGMVKKTGL
jgi:hypothetical protein